MRSVRPCVEQVVGRRYTSGIRNELNRNHLFQVYRKIFGGQGGIRTHGKLAPTTVFKTVALNHSATCPLNDDRLDRVGA
jgi:hypothetical protein